MIDAATVFAWFVMATIFAVIVMAIVMLGSLPANIAKQRQHPHAEAINVASWLGLALGGILWPFALVWAFLPFQDDNSAGKDTSEVEELRSKVADLSAELAALKQRYPSA